LSDLQSPGLYQGGVQTIAIDIQRQLKPSLFQEYQGDETGIIPQDILQWWGSKEEAEPECQVIDEEQYAETIECLADVRNSCLRYRVALGAYTNVSSG